MPTWRDLLNGIIVFDGAMGTMLQAQGVDPSGCPELLNLQNPSIIENIHRSYLEAGAMVVETNSFGGSFLKLQEYGLEEKTYEINKKAAEIAKRAVGEKALVAGSVGPTGQLLKPYGPVTFDELLESYTLQIQGLVAGGADLLIIETMSDLEEVKAAVIAAKNCCDLPIICSLTYDSQGRTMMGVSPEQAIYVLDPLGIHAIGANCSVGPEELLPLVKRMAQLTELPIIVQPNAGLPILKGDKTIYREVPATMAQFAQRFVAAGAQIVGGCCGTTPEHIRAIKEAVADLKPVPRHKERPVALAGRRKLLIFQSPQQEVVVGRNFLTAAKAFETQLQELLKKSLAQIEGGAQVVAIVGDEALEGLWMAQAVLALQSQYDVPVAIEAPGKDVVEAGLKAAKGRALVSPSNQTLGEDLLLLAQKYGAMIGVLGEVSEEHRQTLKKWNMDYITMKILG